MSVAVDLPVDLELAHAAAPHDRDVALGPLDVVLEHTGPRIRGLRVPGLRFALTHPVAQSGVSVTSLSPSPASIPSQGAERALHHPARMRAASR